jgi:Domain of unknown function (DUF3786)
MEKADFEIRFEKYLGQLRRVDLLHRAAILGGELLGDLLKIPFFGEPYIVSRDGVVTEGGRKANLAVGVVLLRYILQCPQKIPATGEWVTYREFTDAGPLAGYFTANTNKTLEATFANQLKLLRIICNGLGGDFIENESGYDLVVKFHALPRIPVLFRFNDTDAIFPAQSSLLFMSSAEKYLDLESLGIVGTFLTGKLIEKRDGPRP